MTVAHEVKAALVDPDLRSSIGERLSARHDQLSLVA